MYEASGDVFSPELRVDVVLSCEEDLPNQIFDSITANDCIDLGCRYNGLLALNRPSPMPPGISLISSLKNLARWTLWVVFSLYGVQISSRAFMALRGPLPSIVGIVNSGVNCSHKPHGIGARSSTGTNSGESRSSFAEVGFDDASVTAIQNI